MFQIKIKLLARQLVQVRLILSGIDGWRDLGDISSDTRRRWLRRSRAPHCAASVASVDAPLPFGATITLLARIAGVGQGHSGRLSGGGFVDDGGHAACLCLFYRLAYAVEA